MFNFFNNNFFELRRLSNKITYAATHYCFSLSILIPHHFYLMILKHTKFFFLCNEATTTTTPQATLKRPGAFQEQQTSTATTIGPPQSNTTPNNASAVNPFWKSVQDEVCISSNV